MKDALGHLSPLRLTTLENPLIFQYGCTVSSQRLLGKALQKLQFSQNAAARLLVAVGCPIESHYIPLYAPGDVIALKGVPIHIFILPLQFTPGHNLTCFPMEPY